MSAPTTLRPGSPEQLERELLWRLGLEASATPEDIETAHETVIEFLGHAPRELRTWVRAQEAGADEAYALLTDPAAFARSAALVGAAGRSAPRPGGPATPPVRRELSQPATAAAAPTAVAAADPRHEESGRQAMSDDEFDALLAEVTPSAHRETVTGGARVRRPVDSPSAGGPAGGSMRRIATVAVGVVLGGMVLLGGAALFGILPAGGGIRAATAPTATPAASAALDTAAVSALMQKYQANPKDFSTLMSLGNEFYTAQDYPNAASWFKQAAAVDATNIDALLALGAASFNSNDTATAEASWKQAVVLDPKNVEAHYDLGYLYFSESPQDVAGVQREWNEVIALDPGSATATQVKAHLATLGSPAPSGSTGPAASTAASSAASGAPSGAPASPAPSPSAASSVGASPTSSPAPFASAAPSAGSGQ